MSHPSTHQAPCVPISVHPERAYLQFLALPLIGFNDSSAMGLAGQLGDTTTTLEGGHKIGETLNKSNLYSECSQKLASPFTEG